MSEQSSVTIVRAVSPSATHAAAPSGLMARWCAPRPTRTRSAIRPVSRSIAETEPAAASLTSAQWPPGATAAIWGERKPRSTAIGRSVRGRRIVTVPDCGLTATAGPVAPAATVVGCAASRTRPITPPPRSDTASTSSSPSAVTSATRRDGGRAARAAHPAVTGRRVVMVRTNMVCGGCAGGRSGPRRRRTLPPPRNTPSRRRNGAIRMCIDTPDAPAGVPAAGARTSNGSPTWPSNEGRILRRPVPRERRCEPPAAAIEEPFGNPDAAQRPRRGRFPPARTEDGRIRQRAAQAATAQGTSQALPPAPLGPLDAGGARHRAGRRARRRRVRAVVPEQRLQQGHEAARHRQPGVEEARADDPHLEPADHRPSDRLRPPRRRGDRQERPVGHADAGAARSGPPHGLAALDPARPVGAEPRRQDQLRLLRGRRRALAGDGRGGDRRQAQLPAEHRLHRLPAARGHARRDLRERRPVLLQPARAVAVHGLLGDRREARLPAPERRRRAGVLTLPPHRRRLPPPGPPADVPARLRGPRIGPHPRHLGDRHPVHQQPARRALEQRHDRRPRRPRPQPAHPAQLRRHRLQRPVAHRERAPRLDAVHGAGRRGGPERDEPLPGHLPVEAPVAALERRRDAARASRSTRSPSGSRR